MAKKIDEPKDPCPKTGAEHEAKHWYLLGREDDGRYAWRCGNCLEVRHSEREAGGPDPIRVEVSAET